MQAIASKAVSYKNGAGIAGQFLATTATFGFRFVVGHFQ